MFSFIDVSFTKPNKIQLQKVYILFKNTAERKYQKEVCQTKDLLI